MNLRANSVNSDARVLEHRAQARHEVLRAAGDARAAEWLARADQRSAMVSSSART
jgi:hypothetical protein